MNSKYSIWFLSGALVLSVTLSLVFRHQTTASEEAIPLDSEPPVKETHELIAEKKPVSKTQDSEFVRYTEEVLRDLPQAKVLHEGQDVHMTPTQVIRGGVLLAEVREKWRSDRTLIPAAERFYRQCAVKQETLESIQALCLRNLWDMTGSTSLDVAGISPRVVELASQLPSLPVAAD